MPQHNNDSDYHGPECCPKCGYDGLRAVFMAMIFKAGVNRVIGKIEAGGPAFPETNGNGAAPVRRGRPPGSGAKTRKKISDKQRADVIALEAKGKNPREISGQTGVHKSTVYDILRTHAMSRAHAPAQKYDCPECGKPFNTPQGLGSHRQKAHGIQGTGKTKALTGREEEAKQHFDAGLAPAEVGEKMGVAGKSAANFRDRIEKKLPGWKVGLGRLAAAPAV